MITALLVIIPNISSGNYTINVEKIDAFSPDRRLVVYKNDKKTSFQRIEYLDGTILCTKENPVVSYGEIINQKELKIIINKRKNVVAEIVKK